MHEHENDEVVTQTPIEILLQVGEDGRVSSRSVFEFLGMLSNHYARWCKTNILENQFAEENVDFAVVTMNGEVVTPTGGVGTRATVDYRLSIPFAKKLCMLSKTERGEQARNYFIMVEDKMKQVATKLTMLQPPYSETKAVSLGEVANVLKIMVSTMKGQNLNPHIVAKQVEITCSQFGIKTIPEFVSKPPYEQLRLPEAATLLGGEA